jgi:tetratricopeptide (TPR) repeat protein
MSSPPVKPKKAKRKNDAPDTSQPYRLYAMVAIGLVALIGVVVMNVLRANENIVLMTPPPATDEYANLSPYERGLALYRDGRPAESIEYFTLALEDDPNNVAVFLARSAAYRYMGDYRAAIRNDEWVIERDAGNVDAWQGAAFSYYQIGLLSDNRDDLQTALAAARQNISLREDAGIEADYAYRLLGDILVTLERPDEAADAYRQYVALANVPDAAIVTWLEAYP